jgi:hypothetical protein
MGGGGFGLDTPTTAPGGGVVVVSAGQARAGLSVSVEGDSGRRPGGGGRRAEGAPGRFLGLGRRQRGPHAIASSTNGTTL